ncbi:hypothetical protein AX14_001839 [Amanita brunnescens Koide BX004]|nr:hypothetical protein AX14_001839 [Amanita brunnescens Koide BX004]
MKVEDETYELLDDVPDEIAAASEKEEQDSDNEGYNEDETLTDAHPGIGYRKIATIIAIVAVFLGLLISTYQTTQSKPKVIYATRYSKEHKFRPAASPIITETLRDGRIRIRGAEPTTATLPKPTPTKRKRKARSKSRNKRTKAKV